jgi:drug/metabolite transporter (DMT)-like permease
MISNVAYLVSMSFITFSEASVIFWTNPVFTAIGARYYLYECLSTFDWAAAIIAFLGILLIQNPFQADLGDKSFKDQLIGTSIALFGSFLSAGSQLTIRKIT